MVFKQAAINTRIIFLLFESQRFNVLAAYLGQWNLQPV